MITKLMRVKKRIITTVLRVEAKKNILLLEGQRLAARSQVNLMQYSAAKADTPIAASK